MAAHMQMEGVPKKARSEKDLSVYAKLVFAAVITELSSTNSSHK